MFYTKGGAGLIATPRNRFFSVYNNAMLLLTPLTFAQPKALFLTQGGTEKDFTPNHIQLTATSMNATTYKTPNYIAPLYVADFNGTTSNLNASLTTYPSLGANNWFTFGAWVYIDATGRNHAIASMGTTTIAWYLIWYNAGPYWEFGYVDTGGTTRRIQRTATLTTGWHYIAVEHGWNASGNNHTFLRYDDATSVLDNQAWLGMRAGAGNFLLGNYSTYWLDGKMATFWLTGYMPDSVGGCIYEYYNATEGLFWP